MMGRGRQVCTEEILDLSPVGDAYKKKGLATAQDRIQMCELAVGHGQAEESAFIMVDTWEPLQVKHMHDMTYYRDTDCWL
jgi:nicotinic acid mononucleotide adenylyltransferase